MCVCFAATLNASKQTARHCWKIFHLHLHYSNSTLIQKHVKVWQTLAALLAEFLKHVIALGICPPRITLQLNDRLIHLWVWDLKTFSCLEWWRLQQRSDSELPFYKWSLCNLSKASTDDKPFLIQKPSKKIITHPRLHTEWPPKKHAFVLHNLDPLK